MTSEKYDEVYRVALNSAEAELTEISVEFNRLRARMEKVGTLVEALTPFVEEQEQQLVTPKPTAQEPAQSQAVEASNEPKKEPEAITSDPFQRRIDHVLGIGGGIRDVRRYTRQF